MLVSVINLLGKCSQFILFLCPQCVCNGCLILTIYVSARENNDKVLIRLETWLESIEKKIEDFRKDKSAIQISA